MRLSFLAAFLTHGTIAAPLIELHPHPDVHLSLVFSEQLPPEERQLLTEKTQRALAAAEKRWGVPLRSSVALYFDPEPDSHNGRATVIPGNRIHIQTEAPALDESIGLSSDYLLETLTHELGHMIPLEQHNGIFRWLDALFGNSSRPIGLWPRWMHEGLAVWTEAVWGGRPASGYIDFQRRQYADYIRRHGHSPLKNADLDGADPDHFSRVEPGELPYHFGYLLLNTWLEKAPPQTLPRFVEASSRSLGSSFRVTFRDQGLSLDSAFQRAQEEWKQTPIDPDFPPERAPLGTSAHILGPFANSQGLTWIQTARNASEDLTLHRWSDRNSTVETLTWPYAWAYPLALFPAAEGESWALVRRASHFPRQPFERVLWRLDEHGHKRCEVSGFSRLREVYTDGERVVWTRSLQEGRILLEEGFLRSDCSWKQPPTERARSRVAFERLSQPSFTLSPMSSISYSRSEGTRSFQEEVIWNTRFLLKSADPQDVRALSHPHVLTSCPPRVDSCGWLQEYSPHYRGPLWIEIRGTHIQARRTSLPTGSSQIASWGERLVLRLERWEQDEIYGLDISDFREPGPPLTLTPLPANSAVSASVPSSPLAETTAKKTTELWPHFWVPTVMAAPGGWILMGQTFSEDLSGKWADSLYGGYDSSIERPFAQATLTRNRLDWGPLSSLGGGVSYAPTYNYYRSAGDSQALDRWGTQLFSQAAWLLPREWLFQTTAQYQYLFTARTHLFQPSHSHIPSVTYAFSSPHAASSTWVSLQGLSQKPGLRWSQQIGWVKRPFTLTQLRTNIPLGSTAWHSQVQVGTTSSKNFPVHSFEWGGIPQFSTPTTVAFMSRGFRPRMAAAKNLLRLASEYQFSLGQPHWALSWNRARLSAIESRLIAETVSFTSFSPNSRYKMGSIYFTSAGATLDFWGSLLNYVNIVSSVGLFRGFGPFGETRVTLMMQTALDL